MKIEKIKKMSNDKYKITFEEGESLTTYDEVIINNNLLYKKDIDNNLYEKMLEENKYYDLYNKCIKLISNKMRSVGEIERYLKKEGTLDKDIKSIIEKLSKIGLLNDKKYAKAYVSDKMNFTQAGPYKIEQELLDNNIDINIIKEELSKFDKDIIENKITKYIDRKSKSNKSSIYLFRQKILAELINMGYDKEMILPILDNVRVKSNVEADYKKIYNKLSRKYEGEELYRNIKNKLYQKGYNKEEIDDVIKKVD